MNVVMSSEGRFVEVQGTGEHGTFDRARARPAARSRRRRASRELDAAQQRRALARRERAAACCSRRGARASCASCVRCSPRAGIAVIDLDDAGIAESRDEDELEVFETFEENALAKARYFHALTRAADRRRRLRARGRRARRRAGRAEQALERPHRSDGQALDDENNRLLLERAARTSADRRARYVCAAAYRRWSRANSCVAARCTGGSSMRRAATDGFGYDPVFLVATSWARTFGEASVEEKERGEPSRRARFARCSRSRASELARSVDS